MVEPVQVVVVTAPSGSPEVLAQIETVKEALARIGMVMTEPKAALVTVPADNRA
jgi:hypothetical protein